MRFFADMGVDLRVVEWLRREGHDAVHAREKALERATDAAVFGRAVAERRVVPTFDLDFGEIAALSRGKKTSVVVFRLRNTRAPRVFERLAATLSDCANVLEEGAIVAVEESRHRIRRLPIGESGAGR